MQEPNRISVDPLLRDADAPFHELEERERAGYVRTPADDFSKWEAQASWPVESREKPATAHPTEK
ncbi:MAG TPA: hypothetical protein VNX18_13110 [Bryobacteraceae bacterium]|nr:hypothetical protein [Bryobacteraceae bacterium]